MLSFKGNLEKFANGTAKMITEGLQCVVIVPIFVLALILVIEGGKVLLQTDKAVSYTHLDVYKRQC